MTDRGAAADTADAGAENPTRQRIIDAALHVFYENGTFAASMRDLAVAADISVQGLYYHFPSKGDLVRETMRMASVRGRAPAPVLPASVTDRVRTQAHAEFEAFTADPQFVGLLAMEAVRRQPDAIEAQMALYQEWHDSWRDEIIGGADDLDPKADVEAAATVVTTFLWGLNITFVMTLDRSLGSRIDPLAESVGQLVSSSPRRPRGRVLRIR